MTRSLLRRAASLGLAVALLGWFLWLAWDHVPAILQAAGEASPVLLLAAMGMQVLHLVLRALRWRLLLAPVKRDIRFYNLFSTTIIGYLASTIFPFRVGEVVRPLMLAGRERISRGAALATVGVERVLDTLTVAGFLAIYLLLFRGDLGVSARSSPLWQGVRAWAPWAGGALLLAGPLLFLIARHGETLLGRIAARLPQRLGRRLGPLLGAARGFLGGMAVAGRPGQATVAALASAVVWLSIAAATWLGVQAMGMDLPGGFPPQATLLLVPVLAVGVSTPTPGGLGGYHIICLKALEEIFGASRPEAWATAFVLWLVSILPMLALGMYYLARAGVGMRDLSRMGEGPAGSAAAAAPGGDR